ncbi:hypothetical protein B9Z55_011446 [Caenorhabditis nigoni]|uniref:C2H2-type domain-containing protein n=2 Tax=Caenorhabditis nigoni TaxID=1611254 RepID=A0A2G5UL05_9PELO|nr:hypothetical protein B9Z55_011446 [Caenorhabditis nigoni]
MPPEEEASEEGSWRIQRQKSTGNFGKTFFWGISISEDVGSREYNSYLEHRECRKAARELCELMDHESVGCECFEADSEDVTTPEMPTMLTILQPDRKFDRDPEFSVAGIFTYAPDSQFGLAPILQKKNRKLGPDGAPIPARKPYAYKDRKRKNAEERRDIKKKLFMDLGIIRTSSGIDNEEKNREEAMKRKVTETIVTTYCELCEQNFSSSKMLLLHRNKVHNTAYIECHLCLKLFTRTIQFNRHMKTHYGPNAMSHVQCELCERQFKDKESLKTHWEVSHKDMKLH